jgi:WD40 repeat protein
MPWKLPRPRYGLRTLLVLMLACAIGLALWTSPGRWRTYRNQQARQRIDAYELATAGDGNPRNVPPELVAILGDSRLKHWSGIGHVEQLSGDLVASYGRDEAIRIWDASNGQQVSLFSGADFTTTDDGQRIFLAEADGSITCREVAGGKVVRTFGGGGWEGDISLACNADGSVLVVEKRRPDWSREITVWDARKGVTLHQFTPATQGGGAMCVTRDGKLFTWEQGAQVQVAESATGKIVRTIGPILSGKYKSRLGKVVLSADESKLFVGSANEEVVVFDWQTGEEIERVGGSSNSSYNFALGSDRRIVVGQPPAIYTRQPDEWQSYGGPSLECPGGVMNWKGERIAVGREGELAFFCSYPPLSPWRVPGKPVTSIHCASFHPTGRELLIGDSTGRVTAYEVGTWEARRSWPAHNSAIESLALSANGSKIATTSTDGLAVWDFPTWSETVTVRQFMFSPLVGLSPDGKFAVTGFRAAKGDVMEIWDVGRGSSLGKLGPLPSAVYGHPVWSPDGKRLVCTDMQSTLHAFDMNAKKHLGPLGKSRFGQQKIHAVWMKDSQRLVAVNFGRDEVHLLEFGKKTPVSTIHTGSGQVKWVALHPTEKWIATCGTKTPVEIWHLPTSKRIKSWQIGPFTGSVKQVEFSPDGHYLATVNGNGTAYVLSLEGILTE